MVVYGCFMLFLGSGYCLDGSDAVLFSNVWPVESGVNDAVYHDDLCHSVESWLVCGEFPARADSYSQPGLLINSYERNSIIPNIYYYYSIFL